MFIRPIILIKIFLFSIGIKEYKNKSNSGKTLIQVFLIGEKIKIERSINPKIQIYFLFLILKESIREMIISNIDTKKPIQLKTIR